MNKLPMLLSVVMVGFSGCSANDAGPGFGAQGSNPNPENAGTESTGDSTLPSTDAGSLLDAPVPSTEAGPLPEGDTCYADTIQAERAPLAMYIMMDKSGSMTDLPQPIMAPLTTKWVAVKNALGGFMKDPASTGISVAIQFFPLAASPFEEFTTCTSKQDCGSTGLCVSSSMSQNHCYPYCTTSATCGKAECLPLNTGDKVCGNDTCDVKEYTTPEVDFQPLPGVQGAIQAALNAHHPTTATPTLPALTGAIDHAKQWAAQHPEYKVIVVLATDGLPTVCPVDLPQNQVIQMVADVAKSGFQSTPSIRTFVIGITTPMDGSAANLETIAKAGGTVQALNVQGNADVAAQFVQAMEQIRGAALACEFQIPSSGAGPLDYNRVNVLYSNATTQEATVYHVDSPADCHAQEGGWYYNPPPAEGTPTRIILCPASCSKVQDDSSASIALAMGCETQMMPK